MDLFLAIIYHYYDNVNDNIFGYVNNYIFDYVNDNIFDYVNDYFFDYANVNIVDSVNDYIIFDFVNELILAFL